MTWFVGVWGTDVEIFAAAILLKTSIYVYSTAQEKWHLFHKHLDSKKKTVKRNEKCIYLRNIDNEHYDVVVDVKWFIYTFLWIIITKIKKKSFFDYFSIVNYQPKMLNFYNFLPNCQIFFFLN